MASRLTIIGGGPGGYTAAFAAARAGLEVTIVEKNHIGGTCLNYGCIPTKTIKTSSDALELAKHLDTFGIEIDGTPSANIAKIIERKNNVIRILRTGLEKTCTKLKISLITGVGEIISNSLVRVHGVEGESQDIESDIIIIATGSGILELPGLKFDHKYIINSDDALELDHIPNNLCIVGGGVIGCEMAFIFNNLGSKVTLIEGLERLLPIPSIDLEVSKLLQREMKKHGIACELGRTLKDAKIEQNQVHATLGPSPFIQNPSAAQSTEKEIQTDMILVTVGRTAQNSKLNLDKLGINTDSRGWVLVNENMQTSIPNIYAIGDILGPAKVMLAHVAAAEGLCAINHILNEDKNKSTMDYSAVPSAIFTSPEVGCVGLSEEQAKELGEEVFCPTLQMRELGKAHAMGELPGFVKLIIRRQDQKILGAHIVGAHATDLIAEVTLAMQMGANLHDIVNTIHAHPTLAEGIFEAALLGLGH